jgi:hypothetical protein
VFRVILRINSDYYPKQYWDFGLYMKTLSILRKIHTKILNMVWMKLSLQILERSTAVSVEQPTKYVTYPGTNSRNCGIKTKKQY